MEEDVEIELLYQAHGQMLMEAAAVADDDDDGEVRVCENEGSEGGQGSSEATAAENSLNVARKNYSRPKAKRWKNLKTKRNYNRKKEETVSKDYSTDVDELIDCSILTCVLKNPPDSDVESYDDTDFESNNEMENCINEILDDEPLFRERRRESRETKVQEKSDRLPDERCILELESLQNIISKRDCVIGQLERKLKEELVENECELKRLQEQMNAFFQDRSSNPREPSMTKCFFKKFGIPYFHDRSNFPAPQNDDVKEKLKNSKLILSPLPKLRYWRKSHKDKLQDAIQQTLVNENSDKLLKEIDKLRVRLESVPDEQTERVIVDKIRKCQILLKSTKSKSFIDLVANENPNREYDWLKYAATDFNLVHSAEECKSFWHLYLKPTINKSRWDRSEDEKLKQIAEEMNCQDWKSIAERLGTNRTAYQCFIHYRNRLYDKQDFSVGKWTKEEDEKLLNVINYAKIGDMIPWTKVASYMGVRNHNQVYNRYVNSLDPKLVKGRFSKEEDLLIVSGIDVFGVSYKEIASLLSNRTTNQVRERYERYLLQNKAKKGSFSLEEDEKLLKLIDKHGERNFALVAKEMKTRTRTQVRQRYNLIMQLMRTKPGWTPAAHKRRNVHSTPKNLTKTQKKVEKLKKEVEDVEKTFQLTKLEIDTFKIEKLKELRDEIFLSKVDVKKYKKKTFRANSKINHKLLNFFKYQHLKSTVKSSDRQNSVDDAAYLKEILLLAKYFGHDLQLPKSKDEILENKNLSTALKTFLVETLKLQAVHSVCDKPNAIEASSVISSVREPHNINYVNCDVDDTMIMEERWFDASFNVSNLNFGEIFKQSVFDYSSGMHQDIWDSKVHRSKKAAFNYDINISKPSNDQQYFFPPNSLTAQGYKSILLFRTRLNQNANSIPQKQLKCETVVQTKISQTIHHLEDKFQDTLLTLFYCPKVLSATDITATSLPPVNSSASTFISIANHEGVFNLLNNSNLNTSKTVRKVAFPMKNDDLQAKTIERNILEHNQIWQRKLKEFRSGITFKRKMGIEHLIKKFKEPISKKRIKKSSKQSKKECTSVLKENELNNGNDTLHSINSTAISSDSNSINIIDNSSNKLTREGFDSEQSIKTPPQTYSRTRQASRRHLNSDKYIEPKTEKSSCTKTDSTESTQPSSSIETHPARSRSSNQHLTKL